MRFAIAGTDRYRGVFEAFMRAGWQPAKVFGVPADTCTALAALAEQHAMPFQLSRLTEADFQSLRAEGCEALIVGCYPWKIGEWEPYLRYAANFHASPLPEGRGPYPATQALLEGRTSWAVTCHRLAADFDTGDILSMEQFPLQADECHESLDLKIQLAATRLAGRVAGRFPAAWAEAFRQGEGSYWPRLSLKDRVIDFNRPVADILRHVRAFGTAESLARVSETWLVVTRAAGWPEHHAHPPGTVVHVYNGMIVIAAADGLVALLEAGLAQPDVVKRLES